MHRCLFSCALPAEIRCLSARFLTQRQPPRPKWQPTQSRWRAYSTGLDEKRQIDSSWIESSHASQFLEDSTWSANEESGEQHGLESHAERPEDPYDFILEGYAAEPMVRQIRRERMKEPLLTVRRAPSRVPVHSGPSRAIREKRVQAFGDVRRRIRRRAQAEARRGSRIRVSTWARLPKSWTRPKYVTLGTRGNTSDEFSRTWNMNFARACNQTDRSQSGSRIGKLAPTLDTRAAQWVEIILERQHLDQPLDLYGLAQEYRLRKSAIWSNIALWLLYYDRGSILDFLHSTSGDPQVPASRVADCLHLCLMHLASLPAEERDKRVNRSIGILCNFAERQTSDKVVLVGASLRYLLKFCNSEQMAILYQAVRDPKFRVHFNTHLHFASALAKNDHFHQGLDALLQARQAGARTQSQRFRSVCATLLRRSVTLPGGMRVCLRIVDNLVKIGVTLNIHLCNVLILNAVEVGDLKTAYAIYHSLVEHKVKADTYTYALLLKGCKQTLTDSETLNETIRSAIAGTKVMSSPVLATEILHCLALHHTLGSQSTTLDPTEKRANSVKAWSTICQAYAQLFDLSSLEALGLPIPASVRFTPQAKKPMPATPYSIGIMLQTYGQLIVHNTNTSSRAYDMYTRYKSRLEHDPLFAKLTQTDHCANVFLMLFIKNKTSLIHAAEVIKDMQKSAASDPSLSCPPTVQSYSIFLHGFTRHGQMKLAEQVLAFMRNKGIEPNEVTWNTLLTGYAGAQDVEGLLDASRRFEASGHVWDEWTYGGLRRLRDMRKYRELIEGKARSPRLDFTQDLVRGLGDRISGVEQEGEGEEDARSCNDGEERRVQLPDRKAPRESEAEGMASLIYSSEQQRRQQQM